jgi:glycosyltransferase involved in cell wall biosynthesis
MGCRLMSGPRRRFIFCLASDANFGAHLRAGRLGLEGKIYQYGLRRANRVIAQTLCQKEGLLQATGLQSEVIPMAVVPPFTRAGYASPASPPHVLWVGRITPGKRLEWLLEAARRSPEIIFDVVGTPNKDSEYATAILAAAASLPNVQVHGRASNEQLVSLYRQATVLCCTSTLEGFPTTFLEAWSCGIPVVTTFDPDGVVARYGLGEVATDMESLVSGLANALHDSARCEAWSSAARKYYLENHALETVSRRFQQMVQQVLGLN